MTEVESEAKHAAEVETLRARVAELESLVKRYESCDTMPPGPDEDTGPVSKDPIEFLAIKIDRLAATVQTVANVVVESNRRIDGLESEIRAQRVPEWANQLLQDFQRVVELEQWRKRRDQACGDCPRWSDEDDMPPVAAVK